MDVVWQEGLRSPGRLGCIQHQLEGSILIADPPPSACSSIPEQAYALTHAIFYTTDFGQRPLPEKVVRERLRSTVDAVLAWRLAREDFDLIGELLLAVCCSGMEWSPYCWLAWRTLVDAREQLGEVPGPNLDSLHRNTLSPVEARAYAYRHTYHTMYVFGLLCAQLLGFPETASPALAGQVADDADGGALDCNASYSSASSTRGSLAIEWPERSTGAEEASEGSFGGHRDRLDRLLNFADPEGTLLFLRGAVLNSDIDWKVVAGVLMDCALVRSARAYDLPRAAYGLLEVVRLSLPASRVSLDVAEFLARQQFRADATRHPLPVSQATSEVLQARDFIGSSLSVFARFLRESGRSDVMKSPVVNEY